MLGTTTGVTGTLARGGTDMVRATVYTRPVPSTAPDELADVVAAVEDRQGGGVPREWRLASTRPATSNDLARFQRWRGTFATNYSVGERASVSAFVDWADHRGGAPVLGLIRQADVRLDTAKAMRLRREVDQLRQRCDASTEQGLGLFADPTYHWPERRLVRTDPPTTLLAVGDTGIDVGPTGLRLHRGPDAVDLHEWAVDDDTVLAVTSQRTLRFTDRATAELLNLLGRRSARVVVRDVPLAGLFTLLFGALHDAAALAGDLHTEIYVHVGPDR